MRLPPTPLPDYLPPDPDTEHVQRLLAAIDTGRRAVLEAAKKHPCSDGESMYYCLGDVVGVAYSQETDDHEWESVMRAACGQVADKLIRVVETSAWQHFLDEDGTAHRFNFLGGFLEHLGVTPMWLQIVGEYAGRPPLGYGWPREVL